MRGILLLGTALLGSALGLMACTPPDASAPSTDQSGGVLLPSGRWLTAAGASEAALVFVPESGAEIALICALDDGASFRVETSDPAFDALGDVSNGAMLIGSLAIEGSASRMATDQGNLTQMRTPITEGLIHALQGADFIRFNVGTASAITGAPPAAELTAFANACASFASSPTP
jgi:hypothetical protein